MNHEMKLIPFTVESMQTEVPEVPYGVRMVQAPEIWEKGEQGEGVVIAILDTGCDSDHPDLKDNIIGGKNFTDEGDRNDFHDGNSHGTHVAGTIAGNGKIKGVAPKAKLLIIKVLNSEGSGSYKSITDGIRYATAWKGENGEKVSVISMSLGGAYSDPKQYKAILEACAAGILVVVASGNEGDNREESYEHAYPALYPECVTVAACDENKKLAGFSNNHLQVDIIAPGVKVLSTFPGNNYAAISGTSMATPHISGCLALIKNIGRKQFKRELQESELYGLLAKSCCSLGYQKSSEGHGMPELTRLFEEC
jgi:major intracellular serine protease